MTSTDPRPHGLVQRLREPASILTGLFLLSGLGLLILQVDNQVLKLQRDEVYFLHEAYAYAQGWLAGSGDHSFPYDLYTVWLSQGISIGDPSSLWRAVAIDTVTQFACQGLLALIVLRAVRPFNWMTLGAALAGLAFFFSLGRLADHRPDYLSVTALSLGAFALVGCFKASTKSRSLAGAAGAGVLFALAACFSPRAMVVMAVALPLLALWLLRFRGLRDCLTLGLSGSLGFMGGAGLIWALTGFSLVSAIAFQLTANYDPSVQIPLLTRFLDGRRLTLVLINAGVLIASLGLTLRASGERERLFAWGGFAFAVGQLFLIAYDTVIYPYGYSYGLAGYLLMLVPLAAVTMGQGLQRDQLAMAFAAYFACFLLFHALATRSYIRVKNFDNYARVSANDSTYRLLREMHGVRLIPKIKARVLVCKRLAGRQYVALWQYNPICLRPGFTHFAQRDGLETHRMRRIDYPTRPQLRTLLRAQDLPGNSRGMVFVLEEDGQLSEVVPMP